MIKVDARGQQCPIPVVQTKRAIQALGGSGEVEVLVDNEIAVQNLTKMAEQKGYGIVAEKSGEREYRARLTVFNGELQVPLAMQRDPRQASDLVVVVAADVMGRGDEALGRVLLKGFIYALAQTEELPESILFYNRGAFLTTEGSDSLADLQELEARGVKIFTCGTCLNHYGLTEKLLVGSVTNMYTIVEQLMSAGRVIKP